MTIKEKILDWSGMTIKCEAIEDSGSSPIAAASGVSVAGTATNYTASAANVESHLAGINTAMGLKATSASVASAVTSSAGVALNEKIPLNLFHPAAALKDALGDAGDGTTLGLADAGLFLVGSATSGDTKTETATAVFALSPLYKEGGAVNIVVRAKVSANQAVAQTLDLEVKKCLDGALGADICATAVKTLTGAFASYTFSITPTDLVPGDILHIKLTAVADDTGGSTAGHVEIASVAVSSLIAS